MPGVFRPYTLPDILGSLIGQQQGSVDTSDTPTGVFAEADEATTVSDSVTGTVGAAPGWDQGTWGTTIWQ